MRNGVAEQSSGDRGERLSRWWQTLWPTFREAVIDGVSARYLCTGSGPPVLLLASPHTRARSYLGAMRALARSFTVVCVELPGSGGSSRLERAWDVDRYAAWTVELIRRLPLAMPIVIGHAASAPVALALTERAPHELGGAFVVECPDLTTALSARALPEVVANAVRHRGAFVQQLRALFSPEAGPARLAAGSRAFEVPVVRTSAAEMDVEADGAAFGAAFRRFFATACDVAAAVSEREPVLAVS